MLEQRTRNILEGLVTSETSTGHPRHREYIRKQLSTSVAIVEAAALSILESGEPDSDIERSLVKLIEENRYNRFLAKDGNLCSFTPETSQ
jgi:hypothetical protein